MYGSFLRRVRTSRQLSQSALAEIVGISQPNLSAYENDRRSPTVDVLNRLVVACGYQLVADGGSREVRVPLPQAGWFPDDDLPPRLADDPPDEPPSVPWGTPPEERSRAIHMALAIADTGVGVDVDA